MTIERLHFFHTSCSKWDKVSGPVPRFVHQPDADNAQHLSQGSFRCDRCGEKLHVDVWPMQPIPATLFEDPA